MSLDILLDRSELKDIISKEDPDEVYDELEQIGHGNFGAVFCAKSKNDNSTVAIKKIQCNRKQIQQKLTDIINEMKVLTEIKHENAIGFIAVYWKDFFVWLVMEYCVGSLVDIMIVSHEGFEENDISYICSSIVRVLSYCHNKGWIHRDIKAANILITDKGIIKLADFGSASLKSPANTFIGSPYWMAPEVILAMEDGLYDQNSDIWSLGITAIELAETKPPRFEMNAMSALYYIAQNDPPQLVNSEKYTPEFIEFVTKCLNKEPSKRPKSMELLTDQFVNRDINNQHMIELIQRCLNQVVEIDQESYVKLKTLCYELTDSETVSENSTHNLSQNDDKTQEATTKIKLSFHRQQSCRTNTIKLSSKIAEECQNRQNVLSQNLDDYRLLRNDLNKLVQTTQLKLSNILAETKRNYERQLDAMKHDSDKTIEKFKLKHSAEFEALVKSQMQIEKKRLKLDNITSKGRYKTMSESQIQDIPQIFYLRQRQILERLMHHQNYAYELMMLEKNEGEHHFTFYKTMHETLCQMRVDHFKQICKLKREHFEQMQEAEIKNQNVYSTKLEVQLRKKHINELKQKPKTIKSIESTMRKSYMDNARQSNQSYRQKLEVASTCNPKENMVYIKQQLKREHLQNLATLEADYQESRAKKSLEMQVQLNSQQEREKDDLTLKLQSELDQLKKSQSFVKKHIESQLDEQFETLKKEIDDELDRQAIKVEHERLDMSERIKSETNKMEIERSAITKEIEKQRNAFNNKDLVMYPPSSSYIYTQLIRNPPNSKFRPLF